jgi:enolase
VELRDGEKGRYLGKGVRTAVKNVNDRSRLTEGLDALRQADVDRRMIQLDGTSNKGNWERMRSWRFPWLLRAPQPTR